MEIFCRTRSKGDENSPAKCKERRRHRIEMRRLAALSLNPSTNQHRKENETKSSGLEKKRVREMSGDGVMEISSSSSSSSSGKGLKNVVSSPFASQLLFGVLSVSGRSRDMEDAVSISTCLIGQETYRRRPVHFFAVYDGHGGSHVSALCREKLHLFVQEEWARAVGTLKEPGRSGGVGGSGTAAAAEEATWGRVMRRSFERIDEVALNTCACGSFGGYCGCEPMEVALGGSTAVVAVLTPYNIIVANCGDSRAVLCRGGRAIPLSFDQKPDRIDELERIKAAGGRVISVNGARVEGILAMSRAIGDKYLKPIVISEPEITFTRREADDECLILASDGLWDVLSSDLACEIALECLGGGAASVSLSSIDLNAVPRIEDEGTGTIYPSHSALAAALLTRLALARKSTDNISVIVIDLMRNRAVN